MNGQNINKPGGELKILIAPLDWGLGHATRCVPIIYALLAVGVNVFIAGENTTEKILKKEFPNLPFLPIRGYKIKYSKSKTWFLLKLLYQFPFINKIIRYEYTWLQKIVKEHKIDAVISDNRFGLYHASIPTVYITHQLHIETGIVFLNKIAKQIHYRFINRFTECWVPDAENATINFAGKLSHPQIPPIIPVKYLGILSRFKKLDEQISKDLIIVLSGPEPQRSIFENIILDQLKVFEGSVVLVRGLPLEKETISISEHIEVHNYLPANELNLLIQQSAMVLARSGYSTIMDLACIQQKAILVPTPGQAEQEYLAEYLKREKIFYSTNQKNFNLNESLQAAKKFYSNPTIPQTHFNEKIIYDWLVVLKKTKELQ